MGAFLANVVGVLLRLLRLVRPQPATGRENTANRAAGTLSPRVLFISYNPVVDVATGKRLVEKMGWADPDVLAAQYMRDVRECSGGLVDYRIVERIEADEFPVKADGFQYRVHDYVNANRTQRGFHFPDQVDYGAIIAKFDLLKRIAASELDEVWLFGGPYFGFYESTMGGAGAFFCNSTPLAGTGQCPRRFVIMGFSYERGVGEMLEDLGHRAESILRQVYRYKAGEDNLFDRYCRYNLVAPAQANVGLLHFAPNSLRDYDWGNRKPVPSCCDDWYRFPDLANQPHYRMVNASEWGNGDIRLHHRWWFEHLPKASGETGGISNNWWTYVMDPNTVE